MNTLHAPDRCDARATRIAKVKFVALELDMDAIPDPDEGFRGQAAPGTPPGEATVLRAFRSFLIRVIGRLEAARP